MIKHNKNVSRHEGNFSDEEMIKLVKEAMSSGISKEEFKNFIIDKGKQTTNQNTQ